MRRGKPPAVHRLAIALAACGSAAEGDLGHGERQGSPLELAIARDLTARFGASPAVRCYVIWRRPVVCTATLADRTRFTIAIRDDGARWRWAIEGKVVAVAPIEAFIHAELTDLGAAQGVACGARVQHLASDRLTCELEHGGKAFATIAADGTLAVELALDVGAAKARSDGPADLEKRSRALAHTEDEDDEVESAP